MDSSICKKLKDKARRHAAACRAETLKLISIPGFRESIERSKQQELRGETYSMEDVFGEKATIPYD